MLVKRFLVRENNMEHEQKIVREVKKTLELLEQTERLKPNPFFFTRVQARIQEKKKEPAWQGLPGILKPVLLAILLAMNIFTAVYFLSTNKVKTSSNVRSELKSEFAQEFRLQTTTNEFFITQ